MVGPPPRKSGNRSIWRGLLRAARLVALVVYALLTATGALMSPGLSLALGVLFAVIGAALVVSLHRGAAEDLPPLPHPLAAGIGVVPYPPRFAGTATLGANPRHRDRSGSGAGRRGRRAVDRLPARSLAGPSGRDRESGEGRAVDAPGPAGQYRPTSSSPSGGVPRPLVALAAANSCWRFG
jgi:hypothetical protein